MNNEPQGAIEAADALQIAKNLLKWKNYIIYALVIVALVEGGIMLWQRGTVQEGKAELAKQQTVLHEVKVVRDLALANLKECMSKGSKQNKSVKDASDKYKRVRTDFDNLQDRIDRGDFYKPADDIRNQLTPKTCKEALDFMNRNLK